MRFKIVSVAFAFGFLACATSAQNTVKYHATINDVKYVYGVAPAGGPPQAGRHS